MDISILKWFSSTFHSQQWLNYIMKYVTYLGEFGAGAIVAAIVLLCFKRTRRCGIAVAIAFILDLLIVNVILKLCVNRARPWQTYPDLGFHEFHVSIGVREPTDSSFPSGHTAALFCAAVAITLFYKAKGIPALIAAFLVALSRVYLCMHFPTDVLAGMLIGSACGVAGYFASKPCEELLKKLFARIRSLTVKKSTDEASDGEQPPTQE